MQLKRFFAGAALAGLVLATAAGCSRFGGSGDTGAKSLSLWVVAEKEQLGAFNNVAADFEKKTGIKVKVTGYQNDQFKQNIANATGTSAMPDIFLNWSGIGLLGNIYDSGTILPLDDTYKKMDWEKKFDQNALKLDKIDGKWIGVPAGIQEMAVVYKKSTMEKAGITEMPKTFDELLALNDKLVAKGITPWSFAGKQPWDLMRLSDSLLETACGAETFDALRDLKADWATEPCAVKGFTELQNWIDKGYLTKDFMSLDPNNGAQYQAIFDGTAAMTIDGNWSGTVLKRFKQDPNDFGFFVFPTDTNRVSYFTTSWYINKDAPSVDNAVKFVDYITDAKVIEDNVAILNGAISPTVGTAVPSDLTEYEKAWYGMADGYDGVYLPSDQAFVPDVSLSFLRNQDKLAIGQETPQQAVDAIQTDAKTYKSR